MNGKFFRHHGIVSGQGCVLSFTRARSFSRPRLTPHLHLCPKELRAPLTLSFQKAVEEEYDLDNPAVISFLVNMQEGHQAKLEAPRREGRPHGGGSSECEEHNGDNGSTEGDRSLPDEDADQVRGALALPPLDGSVAHWVSAPWRLVHLVVATGRRIKKRPKCFSVSSLVVFAMKVFRQQNLLPLVHLRIDYGGRLVLL